MSKSRFQIPSIIESDLLEITETIKHILSKLEGKSILIAGAAGFLPSYIVHTLAYANAYLFKKPAKIICLDNFRTGVAKRLSFWQGRSDIKFISCDISKKVKISDNIDYIIHGASIASPVWYRQFPLETIDVNVYGTRRLLDLARSNSLAGFLYMSSSEIYGDPFGRFIPTKENYWGNVSSTGPRACYDESKRLAETLCMVYFRNFGVPVKIVRPFNVYGPGLRLDDGRVVPDFIKNALEKKPITIFSSGKITRSFCYISDAVSAMLILLTSDTAGEAFNVGNDEEITITRLAKTVDKAAGGISGIIYKKNSDQVYLTDNPKRRLPNLKKIKKAIKWVPKVSLSEGIRRTLGFYQAGGLK